MPVPTKPRQQPDPVAKYISDIRIVDATVGSSIPPLARRGRFASCLFSEGFNSYEIDYLALSRCKAIWLTPLNTLRRLMAERLGSFHARVETMAGRSRGWTRQPRTLSPKNVAVRFTLKVMPFREDIDPYEKDRLESGIIRGCGGGIVSPPAPPS